MRRRSALVPLLTLSLPWTHAALHGNEIWQEKAYLPGMSAITVGIPGAFLATRWRLPRRRTSFLLGWLGVIGLTAAAIDGVLMWQLLRDSYMLLLAMSACCLLLVCEQRHRCGTWRAWPGLR